MAQLMNKDKAYPDKWHCQRCWLTVVSRWHLVVQQFLRGFASLYRMPDNNAIRKLSYNSIMWLAQLTACRWSVLDLG
jgi:hypothetical protein